MFHSLSIAETLTQLRSDEVNGLALVDAQTRLREYGENVLPEKRKKHWILTFAGYFKDVLVLILLAAAAFSFFIGEVKDGTVVLVIIVANALMGFFQEKKADNAIAALKKLSVGSAKVIRNGELTVTETKVLVPGDIILIENGDKIPADARLIEAVYLKVSESALTGESKPVEKTVDPIAGENIPLGDRVNMVYKDTIALFGRGKAIVTATGVQTEMGQISELLQGQGEKVTLLKIELNRVGKGLTVFATAAAFLIFVSILLSDASYLKDAILTAISLAVAVVPEGIPAVVTTVLAISVARLAYHRAIVRKLEAVETLGSASCILTDKTGTLTKNEMEVSDVYLDHRHIRVSGTRFEENNQRIDPKADKRLSWLIYCSVLCNDAKFSGADTTVGDPTEACLIQMARQAGFDVEKIRTEYRRVFEIPFSSETKRMTVVVEGPDGRTFAFTKGACESVCEYLKGANQTHSKASELLAANGIRNLVYSCKELIGDRVAFEDEEGLYKDHEYLGTIGSKDPLRPEVKGAVSLAENAGVKTVMITGDHKLIATDIGRELGIVTHDGQVIDGSDLDAMSETSLLSILKDIRVFSRMSPQQKLRIVAATMKSGETVIVTGDGVNDAPAIKMADIGVAMGISGTDVAKETADMVLQDDNYSTIVEAIKQGRGIFNNFIKFLKYQISSNVSGVLIIFPLTILGFPIPLLPVHILLLNLVSETGPCIALGLEKPEGNVMQTKPRKKNEPLLTKARWYRIGFESILLASAGIIIFFVALKTTPAAAVSATLVTAFLSRLWHALNARSETLSIFSRYLQPNRGLYYTVGGTLIFLYFSIYTSLGNALTKTVPLDQDLLLMSFLLSLIPVIGVEIYKMYLRKNNAIQRSEKA